MIIKVLYFAELKDLTGKENEFINIEKNSIESVISSIIEKHPELKPLLIDGDSLKLKKNVSIAINDKIIENNRKETFILKENDKIAFLLPISGG
ncbi:MAG: MoaD/ThiS family protein [Promethearchaeota archaeon]